MENINEATLVRIVTDALTEARLLNLAQAPDNVDVVEDTLYDVASSIAAEAWPMGSEERPPIPEEWSDAIKGR